MSCLVVIPIIVIYDLPLTASDLDTCGVFLSALLALVSA